MYTRRTPPYTHFLGLREPRNFGVAAWEVGFLDGPAENAPRPAAARGHALPVQPADQQHPGRLGEPGPGSPCWTAAPPGKILDLNKASGGPPDQVRGGFELTFSHPDHLAFDTSATALELLIYPDPQRSFFVKPEWQQVIAGYNKTLQLLRYTFSPMYHPYTALFLRELKRNGRRGLLNRKIQLNPQTFYPGNSFSLRPVRADGVGRRGRPARPTRSSTSTARARTASTTGGVLPRPAGHRHRLSQNQRFEEAMRWFHFIFDPTNTEAPPCRNGSGSPSRSTSRTPTTTASSASSSCSTTSSTTPSSSTRGRTTRSTRT